MKLTIKECYDRIKGADMILLGLGIDFEPDFKAVLNSNKIYKKFKDDIDSLEETIGLWLEYAIYYHELTSNKNHIINEKLEYINRLANLTDKKNIFLVSTCALDIIRFSKFNQERVVTPCGTTLKMECHLGCRKDVYDSVEHYDKLYKKLEAIYSDEVFDKTYILQFIPICNNCEAFMEPNILTLVSYSHEGYVKSWELYNKWLSGTINKNLVMLELGVNFDTPTVIRWPFEKVAMVNKKSLLVRVNNKLAMIPTEIAETSVTFTMSSYEFIDEISKI